ncbi:MAG: hypothetical protein KME43_08030 [Myxacorys chilensis ATA2-1-KO14]|nr:hypothetical protein [Myxacorys chilensis ATA2-1-KO14]
MESPSSSASLIRCDRDISGFLFYLPSTRLFRFLDRNAKFGCLAPNTLNESAIAPAVNTGTVLLGIFLLSL